MATVQKEPCTHFCLWQETWQQGRDNMEVAGRVITVPNSHQTCPPAALETELGHKACRKVRCGLISLFSQTLTMCFRQNSSCRYNLPCFSHFYMPLNLPMHVHLHHGESSASYKWARPLWHRASFEAITLQGTSHYFWRWVIMMYCYEAQVQTFNLWQSSCSASWVMRP